MRNFRCISAPMTWPSLACLLLLVFCSQGVRAEDYYWRYNSNWNFTGSTPAEACEAYRSATSYSTQTGTKSPAVSTAVTNIVFTSETKAQCIVTITYENGQTGEQTTLYSRVGTGCTSPAVYNSETGGCESEPDKCESTKGQQVEHEYNAGPISQAVPNAPDATICDNSCQYSRTATVKGCARFLDNDDGTVDLDAVYCTVMYQGTGQSCTAGNPAPGSVFDQPPSKPPADKTPTYMKDEGCSEWSATSSGGSVSGSMTMNCTKTTEYKQPGNVDCSSGTCKASTPTPEYTKTEVSADTTKTTGTDGSTSTTTTTETSTTKCKGLASCNSTSKSETESESTDADGKTTNSSTCKGDNCKSDEEDDDSGEGDSEEEEEEDSESSVTAGACDVAVECTGDALSCEIIRQQKEQRCADEEFREVTDEKVQDLKTTLDSEFTGDEYQPLEADAENTFDMSSMVDTSRRFSSSCPAVDDINIPYMGKTISVDASQWISMLCPYLAWFGYLIVAFAMRRGAEIVAQGMN